jgi:uncharacterized protein YggT (Ycf19 family)
MDYLYRTLMVFLRVMDAALFIYVIMSWIAPRTQIYYVIGRFVEPFLRPFRVLSNRLLGRFALPIDFSVIFAFIGIEIIQIFLTRLFDALL